MLTQQYIKNEPIKSLQKIKHSDIPFLIKNVRSTDLTETQIERYYSQEIRSGRIAAGTKLPSNQELAKTWKTSSSTVQRALLNIVALGLVDRKPRRGTFVKGKQQRAMVGLLVGPDLSDASASHYRSLNSAIREAINSEFLSCRIYDNLSTLDKAKRDNVLKNLTIDQKYHNFCGFIQIFCIPKGLKLNEFIPEKTQKVVYDSNRSDNDFLFDYADFGKQVVINLHKKGVRRIWYLKQGSEESDGQPHDILSIQETASALAMPPPTILRVPSNRFGHHIEVSTDEFLSALLLKTDKSALPDAIISSDDVAMRGAVFALLKHGIKIPEQLRLASLANEGVNIHYAVPVLRYNFPITTLGREIANLLKSRLSTKPNERNSPRTPINLQGKLIDDY